MIAKIIGLFIGGVVMFFLVLAGISLLCGFLLQFCWNTLLVPSTGAIEITWWQATILFFTLKLIFSNNVTVSERK